VVTNGRPHCTSNVKFGRFHKEITNYNHKTFRHLDQFQCNISVYHDTRDLTDVVTSIRSHTLLFNGTLYDQRDGSDGVPACNMVTWKK
jgi:hypothetical protein